MTLGVIPKVGGQRSTAESPPCSYLRERLRTHPEPFEAPLYGHTHEQRTTFYGGSEFGGLALTQQRTFIRDESRDLTTCVG